ncbi:MAG: Fic family protein [Verrucomicrobia bacterium]|nr:Fic family protein [Verrucomicrobiota bacterium]MCH8511804.1 Fic family protein [Kiritimatiellia bacterium]
MSYEPRFTITPALLSMVEEIAALRERIQGATVAVSWVPALQKDTRTRNGHASTAIEGNPLTLEQVRALEEGRELVASGQRYQREVTNYFAGLRYVEKNAGLKKVRHEHLFELHRLMADTVMDQGTAGAYRRISVRVGGHVPPHPDDVSPLMHELLDWWNTRAADLSPVLSSAILHYRFEDIHPFADGNGRTGRALALWELYRRGFDSHHIFSVDEYYWENRPAYYAALAQVRTGGEDLSQWLEYSANGLREILKRVWKRVLRFQSAHGEKIVLTPKQEHLLGLMADHGSLAPFEIRELLDVSKQGAMNVLNPLIDAGLIEKRGNAKTGKYFLT